VSVCEKIGDTIPDKQDIDEDLAELFPEVPSADNIFLLEHGIDFKMAELDATMPKVDDYTPEAYDK
jgi:hypothetical protein